MNMNRARAAVVVIAAVSAAVHCGSEGLATGEGSEDSHEASAELSLARDGARWTELEPELAHELSASVRELLASDRFEAGLGGTVTTSASARDGTRYVAGVFSGAIRVGGTRLMSRGSDDVFLARVQAAGHVAWARAVGSEGKESGAKVAFEDGHVKLMAMTDGAVDCGRGPLRTWDSEAFFLCTFEADGAPRGGASFPTGR